MIEAPPNKDNWDPKENERTYYRHRQTGNLGWMVRRGGVEYIRLDRPMEELLFPLTKDREGEPLEWVCEERPRLLGPGQAAKIAFEAYKALCGVTGKPTRAKMEWLSMSEQARLDFIKNGPRDGTPLEKQLFRAIVGVLERAV